MEYCKCGGLLGYKVRFRSCGMYSHAEEDGRQDLIDARWYKDYIGHTFDVLHMWGRWQCNFWGDRKFKKVLPACHPWGCIEPNTIPNELKERFPDTLLRFCYYDVVHISPNPEKEEMVWVKGVWENWQSHIWAPLKVENKLVEFSKGLNKDDKLRTLMLYWDKYKETMNEEEKKIWKGYDGW